MQNIREFCDTWKISLDAGQIQQRTDIPIDGWHKTAYHWRCTMSYTPKSGVAKKSYTVEYSMGSAHAKKTHMRHADRFVITPIPPKIEDILYSLASDSRDFADVDSMPTFEEWANDLGYDSDSIKALRVYEKCRDTAINFARFLPGGLNNFLKNVDLDI